MLAHAHVDVVMDERDLLFVQAQERFARIGVGLPSIDLDHSSAYPEPPPCQIPSH